jgi:hypothetical protein
VQFEEFVERSELILELVRRAEILYHLGRKDNLPLKYNLVGVNEAGKLYISQAVEWSFGRLRY